MKKIALITSNKNKEREIASFLGRFGIEVGAMDLDITEIQSESLEEIALDYARKSFAMINKPLICEDAGLFIEVLNGFPGPYSSYVHKTIGNEGILKLLEGVDNRRAKFLAVLAYKDSEKEKIFLGEVQGVIAREKRGTGWGFDPIFIPYGSEKTFGEMSIEEKNAFSHRGKALMSFVKWYLNLL